MNSSSSYRPDIDGLRAIAVLAVMAYHANFALIPGGFIGVDIFFVISGFLISRLIYTELEDGSFRFANFYARRLKRIMPAYIVVAIFTLAVSTYLLIPNDFIFYTTSLAASWGFASNVFFSMLSWGYFGQRTEQFPLLHTWSLSVEEQFYFVFPIFLILLFRYWPKKIVPILIVVGLIFLGVSEWQVGKIGAYFLLPNRVHELLIGVLAFFTLKNYPVQNETTANRLATIGAVAAFGSLFFISKETPFPGVISLFPCVGAALLMYAGSHENVVSTVLRNKVLVWIGLLSYSLYLWHWPLFSFLRYRNIEITFLVATRAIALTFLLSYVTWKFIEMPIRSVQGMKFTFAFSRFYVLPAAVFFSVGVFSYVTDGAPQRFPDDIRQLIASYSFERDLTRSCSIRQGEYKDISLNYLVDHCAFGDMKLKRAELLLFGDSHAYHFKPFVDNLAKNAGLKSVYFVEGSCEPIDLFEPTASHLQLPTICQQRNADLLKMAGNFRYVVLASSWSYKGQEDLFEKKMDIAIQKILLAGATPVIFKDNPRYDADLSQCVLFKKRGWVSAEKNCNIPYKYVRDSQDSMNQVIDRIKLRHSQIIVIDPKVVMCDLIECATSIGNIALYKDNNHLNTKAASLLAERYLALKGNPLAGVHLKLTMNLNKQLAAQ